MNFFRGDVVLALYPFASGTGASRRPAVVVQNDRDNVRMQNTVIVQITTNLRHAAEPTHLLVEAASSEGQRAGLLHNSVISCNNLATVRVDRIDRVIGHLPDTVMTELDACLKAALSLA
jgi:mRNA interferase MazF